jgi:NADPH:quinone reductase-like Zn-dependent oxidoreductase
MTETQMNAVRLSGPGDPAKLAYERIPTPQPGRGEVLVRVHAAAITRDELEWPEDRLPAIPSYEFSGTVAATGPEVGRVHVGEEVYALSPFDRDGAAADYALVPEGVLAGKPATLDHLESAALPLAGLSAWQGLFDHGKLAAGERVLIHGGAGGVGALAVQLARERGAHVIATTSPPYLDAVRGLGAHEVIASAGFEDRLDPVDLVFDTTGGDRLERSPAALADCGRLVSIAAEPPDIAEGRGITALFFVVEPNSEQLAVIARLADDGRLRVTIDRTYPLADARAAFERSLAHQGRGKIVLTVPS